ncbi:hypothetical protein ANCCAN_11916 [Ancylostoma caninum]|uniref:Uncharacterized protein n=1 Tax=Ancylostoma caninum TaxID=29170 RepID=A0A368GCJ8_ANCCA|nr:hypothetical protein ANCCAN_11916 [Ancylostoma caninum]
MRWIEREHFLVGEKDPTMTASGGQARIFLTFCSRFNFILSFRYRTACFGTILAISGLPEAFYGVVDCGARHPKPPCDLRIRHTLTMQSSDGTTFLFGAHVLTDMQNVFGKMKYTT